MKLRINPSYIKGLLVLMISTLAMSVFSQSLPQIEARFANPTYQKDTRTYYLDVELQSKNSAEQLFGMNLRFFYDAALLEFQRVDQFHPGYGLLGEAPKPAVGNEQGGIQLFGLNNAAAYINGGVQLLDERYPLTITPDGWVKAFRVSFKVPTFPSNRENFCPSVIWDVEAAQGQGGFLPGSAGLVITVTEKNRSTRFVSKPTIATGIPMNWKYNNPGSMPHGYVQAEECINLGEIVSTDGPKPTTVKGYALYQNQPNPFEVQTTIEFDLPFAQQASIIMYDVTGAVQEEIEGYFESGRNQVVLKQKPWMVETNVIYYMLKTENYTSPSISMSLVRA